MKDYPYVIGIGASAGGVQALTDFFSMRPSTIGESYVVILHSARTHESKLLDILARHTGIKIVWLKDHMTLEPDTIYICPPRYQVAIANHRFVLTEREPDEVMNRGINYFFYSLGKEVKNKAVGIIMSGTGSDGTDGARLIEDNDGVVIVQDPATAQFDGMPLASIRYDHPDYIRTPREMPLLIDAIIGGREDKSKRRLQKLVQPNA